MQKIASINLSDAIEISSWAGQTAKSISNTWNNENPEMSTTDLNRRAQKGLIQMVICLLSDVVKYHCGKADYLINSDQQPIVRQYAQKTDPYLAASNILRIQSLNNWIDASVNEKLIFEKLAFILSGCISDSDALE